ncbi:uncharacterized protein LOC123387276 [Mustela putorius furo]|uniref:Uncharacterized protein LOC123387276 n=1 Tax=Mustela putorius furo TaxID=9669 RepID=A0A8U0R7L0_MUSPF|nr:uncharacterized protein LOC123387276 [Mustela putorius furo]
MRVGGIEEMEENTGLSGRYGGVRGTNWSLLLYLGEKLAVRTEADQVRGATAGKPRRKPRFLVSTSGGFMEVGSLQLLCWGWRGLKKEKPWWEWTGAGEGGRVSAEEPVSAEEASWWQAGSPGRQSRGRAEARIPERFLENYSPVSCQNREQQWRDQPPRTSSAEETPTLEVMQLGSLVRKSRKGQSVGGFLSNVTQNSFYPGVTRTADTCCGPSLSHVVFSEFLFTALQVLCSHTSCRQLLTLSPVTSG